MALEKVLVVDDDPNICDVLRMYLENEGYSVILSYDGEEALVKFNALKPDIILLDVMLPTLDGWQVCREVRKKSSVPIIMITAKGDTFDKVLGLELGADDYIVKPFEPLELLARVESVLRRSGRGAKSLKAFGVQVDPLAVQVTQNGQPVHLTPREYDLLVQLMRSRGVAIYRSVLYERVWGGEPENDTRTLDLHIQRLRQKLGWADKIETVRGVGYKLKKEEV